MASFLVGFLVIASLLSLWFLIVEIAEDPWAFVLLLCFLFFGIGSCWVLGYVIIYLTGIEIPS